MVDIARAVEYHVGYSLVLSSFRKSEAYLLGSLTVSAVLGEALLVRGSRAECNTCLIVDKLSIDVLCGTENIKARTGSCTGDLVSDSLIEVNNPQTEDYP